MRRLRQPGLYLPTRRTNGNLRLAATATRLSLAAASI
jgi:hypothetical protein